MSQRRNGFLALVAAAAFVFCGVMAANAQGAEETAAEEATAEEAANAEEDALLVDYAGFLALAETVEPIRQKRLVDLHNFNRLASKPNTIIVDSRSADAFAAGHIQGAINIPFSDFTEETLAEKIPGKDVRILIYCNNNFSDDIAPVLVKKVELALNVPTFINLYGYGYENIYELSDTVAMNDPDVHWVAPEPVLTTASAPADED